LIEFQIVYSLPGEIGIACPSSNSNCLGNQPNHIESEKWNKLIQPLWKLFLLPLALMKVVFIRSMSSMCDKGNR